MLPLHQSLEHREAPLIALHATHWRLHLDALLQLARHVVEVLDASLLQLRVLFVDLCEALRGAADPQRLLELMLQKAAHLLEVDVSALYEPFLEVLDFGFLLGVGHATFKGIYNINYVSQRVRELLRPLRLHH